jgi:hypothetical protein
MGEAKRRQKLDPHFGHNYPPQEDNWIFTSANDEIAVNNLNQCLFMAGVTSTDNYQPLTDDNLTLISSLITFATIPVALNFSVNTATENLLISICGSIASVLN